MNETERERGWCNACGFIPAKAVRKAAQRKLAERFRRDLKKAGIVIVYEDPQGRVADFHSLRNTFGTNLQKAGVPSRVAMSLMRHNDHRLTDKIYTDESLLGTRSAIDAFPAFTAKASQVP